MIGLSLSSSSRKWIFALVVAALTLGVAGWLMWRQLGHDVGGERAVRSGEAGVAEAENRTKITSTGEGGHPSQGVIGWKGHGGRQGTSETAARKVATTEGHTSEPLYQETYLAALTAQMEADGRDNALIHYALGFELAPPTPTEEQQALIKQVLEEGWDERAAPLLPYLMAWQAAFAKLEEGAALNYARGIGFDLGQNTPVPNLLVAQYAAKMLAVYSRYLESQGKPADALRQIDTALAMGRDFNSPDNLLINHLIGTAMESIGLRQLSSLAASDSLTPLQLQAAVERLQYFDQGQPGIKSIIDGEMQISLAAIQEMIDNPEANRAESGGNSSAPGPGESGMDEAALEKMAQDYLDAWVSMSERFSEPYWVRNGAGTDGSNTEQQTLLAQALPSFAEPEVRILAVTSRIRQMEIDLAARRYMAEFQNPPPDINSLVNQNYLAAAPADPFTGQPFNYTRMGDNYELYGSGPSIGTPSDPKVTWNPINGTFSPGVIRIR